MGGTTKYLSGFGVHDARETSGYIENGFFRKIIGNHANFLYGVEWGSRFRTSGYDSHFDEERGFSEETAYRSNFGNIGIIQQALYTPSSLEFGSGDYSSREGKTFYVYITDEPGEQPTFAATTFASAGGIMDTEAGSAAGSMLYGLIPAQLYQEKEQLRSKFGGLSYSGVSYAGTSGMSEIEHYIDTKISDIVVEVALTMVTRSNIPNVINIEKNITSLDAFEDETANSATTVGVETATTTVVATSTSTSGY